MHCCLMPKLHNCCKAYKLSTKLPVIHHPVGIHHQQQLSTGVGYLFVTCAEVNCVCMYVCAFSPLSTHYARQRSKEEGTWRGRWSDPSARACYQSLPFRTFLSRPFSLCVCAMINWLSPVVSRSRRSRSSCRNAKRVTPQVQLMPACLPICHTCSGTLKRIIISGAVDKYASVNGNGRDQRFE